MSREESTEAGPPFNKATADVILRSSDKIDFRVHKCILTIASPVFETLFSLPQGGGERNSNDEDGRHADFKDGLQVVQTAQDGATLGDLLRFYYPAPPKLYTIEKVINLLRAAYYYQIDEIVLHLRELVVTPLFLGTEPMRIYAIAWRWGWKDVVERAALQMLQKELLFSELPAPDYQEMKEVPAHALLHLLKYHQTCGEAAWSAVDGKAVAWMPRTWKRPDYIDRDDDWRGGECRCANGSYGSYGSYVAKKWWCDYLEEVRAPLRKKPCKATILSRDYPSIIQAQRCQTCSNYINTGEYHNGLVSVVEEAVRKVPLEFGMPQ